MKTIIPLIVIALCMYGCKGKSQQAHSHETHTETVAHNHDEHNHAAEEHDHAHDGHNHEAEGHKHEAENHDIHDHEHEITGTENHSDEIIFTQAQAARTEFEVKEVQTGTFHQVIKTTGQVLPAPGDESVVIATSNGVISYASNNLTPGKSVKKDQNLFYIASKNVGEGDYYERTRANFEKARSEYERAQILVKDRIVSQKEFESIEMNYRNAKASYDAIAGKQSAQGVGVSSPLEGYIKNISVKDGEYVTAGQAIATVSQNRRLVLRADVSEKHYASLKNIRTANFQTPYDNKVYSLEELSGKLLSTGKAATDNTFFIPVTFEFDNQGDVIPGSFVEIYLISSPLENVIHIPVSALTNEMGYFYVYKQLDAEGYQKQEVEIGVGDGQYVQILKGLSAGDRIVTKGAYQVKMASASAAIPGHSHEH